MAPLGKHPIRSSALVHCERMAANCGRMEPLLKTGGRDTRERDRDRAPSRAADSPVGPAGLVGGSDQSAFDHIQCMRVSVIEELSPGRVTTIVSGFTRAMKFSLPMLNTTIEPVMFLITSG